MDRGRCGALMLTASVLSMALAGCAGGGSAVDVPAPDWKSGYTWSYATQFAEEGTWMENGTAETYNDTNSFRTVRHVFNTSTDLEGEPVYLTATQQVWEDGGPSRHVEAFRQSDLAQLPVYLDHSYVCEMQCIRTDPELVLYGDVPDEVHLDFPLRTGDRWSHILGGDDEDDEGGDVKLAVSYKVVGGAIVDTPVGRLDAARVDIHQTLVDQAAWRNAMIAEAEADGFDVRDLSIQFRGKTSLYYSAGHQAVVREDSSGEYSFRASGTGPDGRPFDFREEASHSALRVLDGARLSIMPERSLQDAMGILDGDLPLDDPSGEIAEVAEYVVELVDETVAVNAQGDGRAAFEARIVEGEMPDEHDLVWTATDAGGASIADGTGPTFSFDPERPGRYQVKVAAVASGQELTGAMGRVDAHWIETVYLDCGPVGATAPPCPRHDLPVHPGAEMLRVTATPEGGVGDMQGLTIYDASGATAARGSDNGGSIVAEVDGFDEYTLSNTAWQAFFARGVSVLQDIRLDVEVFYGDPGFTDAADDGMGRAAGHGSQPDLRPSRLPWS